jgi:hypothetical protein
MTTRQSAGLAGAWLQFSCRVGLAVVGSNVQITADSQPDYASNYFATTSACYAAFTPAFPDPNLIAAQKIVMLVPMPPRRRRKRCRSAPSASRSTASRSSTTKPRRTTTSI